jgi:hypothetical protein
MKAAMYLFCAGLFLCKIRREEYPLPAGCSDSRVLAGGFPVFSVFPDQAHQEVPGLPRQGPLGHLRVATSYTSGRVENAAWNGGVFSVGRLVHFVNGSTIDRGFGMALSRNADRTR